MSNAVEILKECEAFLEGHFLLSSGRHSSAYCQMAYLQQYPDKCSRGGKAEGAERGRGGGPRHGRHRLRL